MCTVTYIPKEERNFILTHSRDESIKRDIASPPMKRLIGSIEHILPIDPVGMGTWIGMSGAGRVASILNGGKEKHQHQPPYRHSRGLIIPEYFQYSDFSDFVNAFDFAGLEPFTLLVFEENKIFEAILDEQGFQTRQLSPDEPFIYSSSSLYPEKSRRRKKKEFNRLVEQTAGLDTQNIMDYHNLNLFEKEEDKSMIPQNHVLKTVSITQVVCNPDRVDMEYFDLVNNINFYKELKLDSTNPLDN